MDMNDIIKLAAEIAKKLTDDKDLLNAFKKDPVSVIEKKLGVDLPNDQLNALIDAVKAKVSVDDAMEFAGKLAGLFGK